MIQAPSSIETDTLADWAEASCLFGRHAFVSESELEHTLYEAGTPGIEDKVSDIRREIDLRHRKIGEAHPVRTQRGEFERTQQWTDNPAYAFQLLLALKDEYESTRITGRRWNDTAKLFERLATLALKKYLQGEAINVGHPRDPEIRSFPDCLDRICNELDEALGERKMYDSDTKDDLVDIVAWRRFGDKRPGQVIILAGCAAGGGWRDKALEIKAGLEYWKLHIHWTVMPISAFAFPYVCLDNVEWGRFSRSGGLLLDRLRITAMFMNGDDSFVRVQTQLKEWCEEQAKLLPSLDR